MKKNIALALASAGMLVGAFTSNANASYVLDGDFNTTPYAGSFQTISAGGTVGAWSVVSGTVDQVGTYWQAPTVGGNTIDLDGNSPGAISQGLTTTAGSYVLSFALSGNPAGGNPLKTVQVTVGNKVQDFTFNTATAGNTLSTMDYITESLVFHTTGATTLEFASLDATGAYGPVLGHVSVSAIPLPASLPMFAATLLGLFGVHSFRKRQLAA